MDELMSVCIVQDADLRVVPAVYRPLYRDTVVVSGGAILPFASVYIEPAAGEYAAQQPWFEQNTHFVLRGRRFEKYGTRRIISHTDLEPFDTVQGVAVFRERGNRDDVPELVYLAYSHGCEFQPYQRR
jgi:hypothetical protein